MYCQELSTINKYAVYTIEIMLTDGRYPVTGMAYHSGNDLPASFPLFVMTENLDMEDED